jgi:hypothetical protein
MHRNNYLLSAIIVGSVTPFLFIPSVALADCWLVGRNSNGEEFYRCNNSPEQLPVCGSEFDRGSRCVVIRPQPNGVIVGNRRNGVDNRNGGIRSGATPFNAGGAPPFNAGGSWPNRAYEYAHGK